MKNDEVNKGSENLQPNDDVRARPASENSETKETAARAVDPSRLVGLEDSEWADTDDFKEYVKAFRTLLGDKCWEENKEHYIKVYRPRLLPREIWSSTPSQVLDFLEWLPVDRWCPKTLQRLEELPDMLRRRLDSPDSPEV